MKRPMTSIGFFTGDDTVGVKITPNAPVEAAQYRLSNSCAELLHRIRYGQSDLYTRQIACGIDESSALCATVQRGYEQWLKRRTTPPNKRRNNRKTNKGAGNE